MRCLFVTHKWGHGLPHTGDSHMPQALIEPFHEWGKGEAHVVWTDESFFSGRSVREQVFAARERFRPDVVVYTPIAYGTASVINVAPEHMRDAGCPVIAVFCDCIKPYVHQQSLPFGAAADLCVNLDGDDKPIGRRVLPMWTAIRQRPPVAKTAGVCFLGSRAHYDDRVAALDALAKAGIAVESWGGRGGDPDQRTVADYLETLDRTLISLNFSKTPEGFDQLKGRTQESLAAHCCLVEHRRSVVARHLEPDVEFAAWDDHDELVRVVSGLLAEPERARAIAARGHAAFLAKWSATCFWDRIAAALDELRRSA